MQWQVKSYETLDSTNQEAYRLIRQAPAEQSLHGVVLNAAYQTAGKGRMGRIWESSADAGVWMTAIIRLCLPMEQASLYSFAAAVSVAEAIRQTTGLRAELKWPNDVLLEGKKVCGILLELVPRNRTEQYLAIGIGVNVNQSENDFPAELQHKAVSLAMQSGQREDCTRLLSAILQRLDENCTLLEQKGFAPIREKWKQLSCMIGHTVLVQPKGADSYTGVAEDLAMDGTLLVRTTDEIISVIAGDVSLRAEDGGYSFR